MLISGTVAVYVFLVSVTKASKDYRNVSACPQGSSEWQTEATRKNCKEPTPDYLCAAIENSPGQYGEICTKYGLFSRGTCAVISAHMHNLDSVPCETPVGCPDQHYNPRELYNWPICFGNFYGIKRTKSTVTQKVNPITIVPANTTAMETATNTQKGDSGLVAGIIIVLLIVLVFSLVALHILDKRNNWGLRKTIRTHIMDVFGHNAQREETVGKRDEEQAECAQDDDTVKKRLLPGDDGKEISWKLTALQRYLVICLKHNIEFEELKEKFILYKSSLVENFKEVLLEPLYSLHSCNDYEKIDLVLVYNLLRNVCEHIQAPNTEWGKKPDDNDLGLGADIERVRLMWNGYCDGEKVFKDMDALYERMQERYGNITEQINGKQDIDQCIMTREKLHPSVHLIAACEVSCESGIVIRKRMNLVKEILEEGNIVICKGALGCGKTTCLKYLDELYRGLGWTVKWKENVVSNPDDVVKENEKILLCCDNLFGTYNQGAYGATSNIIKFLNHAVKRGEGQLKIALAIHDHVLHELAKNTSINILQTKRTIVDLNELSDSEKLLIFKDQRKRGHCATDEKCWFRNIDFESVKNALKKNSGFIGDPAVTLLYFNHHEIFAKNDATLKALCSLFGNILSEKPNLFKILVYTMFVRTHYFDDKLQQWATVKPFGITTDEIKQNTHNLHGYLDVSMDGKSMKMKHELLSIGLFHFCAKDRIYKHALLENCHFQMIEELLRPSATENQSDFSIALDKKNFLTLISRIMRDNLYVNIINHPFMQNEEFREDLKYRCPSEIWNKFFSKKVM